MQQSLEPNDWPNIIIIIRILMIMIIIIIVRTKKKFGQNKTKCYLAERTNEQPKKEQQSEIILNMFKDTNNSNFFLLLLRFLIIKTTIFVSNVYQTFFGRALLFFVQPNNFFWASTNSFGKKN